MTNYKQLKKSKKKRKKIRRKKRNQVKKIKNLKRNQKKRKNIAEVVPLQDQVHRINKSPLEIQLHLHTHNFYNNM